MINQYFIDCMDFMATKPDKSYNLAIVDPPYFSGPEKRQFYGQKISTKGVKRIDYPVMQQWDVPGKEYFDEVIRVSQNQIIWGCNYYDYHFGPGRIIWDKVNSDTSFSDCEIAYCSMHDSVRLFRYMWNGMCQGKSISEGHIMQGNKKLNEKRIHQTQKPVILYDWSLMQYAKPGDKILDTHGGSGSICISCDKAGYDLDWCEKDPVVFTKAIKRFTQHKKQLRLFHYDHL